MRVLRPAKMLLVRYLAQQLQRDQQSNVPQRLRMGGLIANAFDLSWTSGAFVQVFHTFFIPFSQATKKAYNDEL